jgi:two-component system NarL family response regulator
MQPSLPIRALIADDHPLFRDGLATLLQRQDRFDVVGVAADGNEAVRLFLELQPDVTLVDLRMPPEDGIAVVEALRARCPEARTIVLSAFAPDDEVFRAVRAGASGYLLKTASPTELADALVAVYSGETWLPPAVAAKLAGQIGRRLLTPRQKGVLELIAEGLTNQQIGERMQIVEGTVKAHVKSILEKLGARDRTQALSIALRRGLVQIPVMAGALDGGPMEPSAGANG